MTTLAAPPSALGVTHPLDMLTAAEISAARAVLEQAGLLRPSTRFPRVMPVEPPKSVVLAHTDGDDFDRSLDITLLDTDTAETRRVLVSVTAGAVLSVETLRTGEHPYGQAQYMFEEYDRAAEGNEFVTTGFEYLTGQEAGEFEYVREPRPVVTVDAPKVDVRHAPPAGQ